MGLMWNPGDPRHPSTIEGPELDPTNHAGILSTALERLRGKLRYQPIGFELLPKKFTLSQLQHLYELVWDRTVACQMSDARGRKTTLRIAATSTANERATFRNHGRTMNPWWLIVAGFGLIACGMKAGNKEDKGDNGN